MTLAQQGRLPNKIMINTHPRWWDDRPLPWIKELVWLTQRRKGFFLASLRLSHPMNTLLTPLTIDAVHEIFPTIKSIADNDPVVNGGVHDAADGDGP